MTAALKMGLQFPLGSSDKLKFLPTVNKQGSVEFGDGSTDLDVKIFLGSVTEFVLFDVSVPTVDFGADGKGVDLRLFGESAGSLWFWDQSADQLNIDSATVEMDNTKLGEYWRKAPVAKTADYTCVESDSGTIFTNEGDANAINFTLPAVTNTGWHAWFYCMEDFDLKVTSADANLMIADDDVAATSIAFSTATEIVGNGVYVVSDGVKWLTFIQRAQSLNTVTVV